MRCNFQLSGADLNFSPLKRGKLGFMSHLKENIVLSREKNFKAKQTSFLIKIPRKFD